MNKKPRNETRGRALLKALFALTGLSLPTPKTDTAPLPEWKRKSRNNKPVKMPAPKLANSHAGVFQGGLNFKRIFYRLTKASKRVPLPTQHQRVVIGRAAKMGISVKEYEVRYGSEHLPRP